MVVFFSFAGLLIVLFAPEIVGLIVTRDFEEGWIVTPFLVFAFVFHGIYYMVVGPLFLNRVGFVPIITIFGALVNVGFNYFLIPRFGMIGAAIASTLTMLLSTILALALSIQVKNMGYRW